jgi:arylsulfatase A-like enzyme
MVRTADNKLITYQNDPVEQLFDMKNDPWETKNLAGEARCADVMKDLKKRLAEWEGQLEPLSLKGRAPILPKGRKK